MEMFGNMSKFMVRFQKSAEFSQVLCQCFISINNWLLKCFTSKYS